MKSLLNLSILTCMIGLLTGARCTDEVKKRATVTSTVTYDYHPTPTSTSYYSGTETLEKITSTSVSYIPITTGSKTTTFTNYYVSTVTSPAVSQKTVSVPTRAGFTPLASELLYSASLVFVTKTKTIKTPTAFTSAASHTVYTNAIETTYSYTTIYDDSLATDYTYATSTTTVSTSKLPAATVYAACQSNNLRHQTPTGKELFVFQHDASLSSFTGGDDSSDVACCASCQSTAGCVGGYWSQFGQCSLLLRNTTNVAAQCRGSEIYGNFTGAACSPQLITVFNGPCGQLQPYFDLELTVPISQYQPQGCPKGTTFP